MEENINKRVLIKSTNLEGTIVDTFENDNVIYYVVELDGTFDIEEYTSEEVEIL